MRNSNSLIEFIKMNINLNTQNKRNLRIADFCAYALLKNKNYSLTCKELMEKIVELGYKTDGKTLERTISTVSRYQNFGLFDKPRNAKFRLKRSIVRKMKSRRLVVKLNKVFTK